MEIWIGTTEEIFTKIGREKDKLFSISSFRTELHGLRVKHNVNRTLTTINLEESAMFKNEFSFFRFRKKINFSPLVTTVCHSQRIDRRQRERTAVRGGCCLVVADSTDVTQPRDKLPSNCTLLHWEINKQENMDDSRPRTVYHSSPSTYPPTNDFPSFRHVKM